MLARVIWLFLSTISQFSRVYTTPAPKARYRGMAVSSFSPSARYDSHAGFVVDQHPPRGMHLQGGPAGDVVDALGTGRAGSARRLVSAPASSGVVLAAPHTPGVGRATKNPTAEQAVQWALDALRSNFPGTYDVHVEISFAPMMRGIAKASGNEITLNSNEFQPFDGDRKLLTLISALAHEIRHAAQPWHVNIRQKLPITDEPKWWNESHVALDDAASSDAFKVLDEVYARLVAWRRAQRG